MNTEAASSLRVEASAGRSQIDATPRPTSSDVPAYLRPLTAVDGAGSAVLGLVLVVAPGWLASGLGLATDRPIQVVGLLFVLNGLVNGRAAQRPSWARTVPCVAIDLVFAGVMLGLLVADPWSSQSWARWALAGLGLLSLDVGLLKLWGVRKLGN